jgi:hypothetical protein
MNREALTVGRAGLFEGSRVVEGSVMVCTHPHGETIL